MKRIYKLVAWVCAFLCLFPLYVYGESTEMEKNSVEYLDNGDYIITERFEQAARATGTKTTGEAKSYYDQSGELDWKIVLTATFTYDGITAKCIDTSCTVTIYDTNWYKISAVDSFGGASAWATVKLGRKVLGVTVEENTYRLNLSCTPDGNVY